MENQIDNLKGAAFTPSVGSMPSGELMNQTIDTSLGRPSNGGGPGAVRGIASWEGFHNTAPARLAVNGSGYRNVGLHKRRHINPMVKAVTQKSALIGGAPAIAMVSNMTTKSLVEGGTSATKLAELMKLSRLF